MASVIARIRDGPLGGNRRADSGGMHVEAVADDLRGDLVGLQHGADQPRRAMTERRHAVEQMRRVARARRDGRERFLVGRAGVAERHAMPARRRASAPGRARRRAPDASVTMPTSGAGALDLGEDVGGREVGTLAAPSPLSAPSPVLPSCPDLPPQAPPADCADSPTAARRRIRG